MSLEDSIFALASAITLLANKIPVGTLDTLPLLVDKIPAGALNTSKADPSKADPSKADPSKADPSKADPSKADPSKADPSKADPSKAEGKAAPKSAQNGTETSARGQRTAEESKAGAQSEKAANFVLTEAEQWPEIRRLFMALAGKSEGACRRVIDKFDPSKTKLSDAITADNIAEVLAVVIEVAKENGVE